MYRLASVLLGLSVLACAESSPALSSALRTASSDASPIESPPVFPAFWTAGFTGKFVNNPNCTHSGYVYYNSELMLMRTDKFLGPNCGSAYSPYPGTTAVVDGNHHVIRQYGLQFNQTSITCAAFPSLGFITPTYLLNATLVGPQTIMTSWGTSVKTNAWKSTGQYMDGYLLTFTDATTNALVRHQVMLTIAPPYILDFINLQPVPSTALPASFFDPFGSLPCMPE